MEIILTDNVTKKFFEVLKPYLSKAKELKFAVAFAKYSGFAMIEDNILECLEHGAKIEFLLGLDFRTTEPKVLRILHNMTDKNQNVKLFCFSDPSTNDTPVYHPKIYLIRRSEKVFVSIGSSNLTAGGLQDNVEVNAVFLANEKEEIVSDIYGIYNKLKFQKGRFEPNLNYIDEYEETYKTIQSKSIKALREKQVKAKIKALKEQERILPKPQPTKGELFGWQKLVYERLPEGIFNTRDMYAYKDEFQKYYPENKHITDKIRQILQQLRDLKLLRHVSENRWEKI
jgi:HKD family nuclease